MDLPMYALLCSVGSDSYHPMCCSLPGYSIHGIFQGRILEWVAMPSSRESSQPRARTQASCRRSPAWQADSFLTEPPGKP